MRLQVTVVSGDASPAILPGGGGDAFAPLPGGPNRRWGRWSGPRRPGACVAQART